MIESLIVLLHLLVASVQSFHLLHGTQQQQHQHQQHQQHTNHASTFRLHQTSTSDENQNNYEAMLECGATTKEALQGKSVLLTGASGGLGHALALELAKCQVRAIVLSGRTQSSLDALAKECRDICPSLETHVVTCDLSDKASVQQLGVTSLELCGGGGDNNNNNNNNAIDVLINNGGVSSRSNFVDTTLDVDERVMQINFFAGAALAKIVVPTMQLRSSGKIIWISSVQGLLGIPSRTSYAASKFAVQGYCESLRSELASSGISVHVVSPGYIRTNLSRSALTGDGTAHGKLDDTTAKGRPPQEVAVSLLDSVAKGQSDILVAAGLSAKLAIWLRFLFPSFLQSMLVKRFEKAEAEKKKDD